MKTVLLGMNNPISPHPDHALYPYPEGCTGHSIYEMLRSRVPAVTRQQYLSAFERINVLTGLWNMRSAREKLHREILPQLAGRRVICFGRDVQYALKLDEVWLEPREAYGATWYCAPHPSGRNQWYNSVINKDRVAALLAEHYYHHYEECEKCPRSPLIRRDP